MRWPSYLMVIAASVSAAAVGLAVAPSAEAACSVMNGSVQCAGTSPAPSPAPSPAAVTNTYPCVDQWDWEYACDEYSFATGSIDYAQR